MKDVYRIWLQATTTSLLFVGIGYLARESLETARLQSSILLKKTC